MSGVKLSVLMRRGTDSRAQTHHNEQCLWECHESGVVRTCCRVLLRQAGLTVLSDAH